MFKFLNHRIVLFKICLHKLDLSVVVTSVLFNNDISDS